MAKSVEEFLSSLPNKNTRKVYRFSLMKFFDSLTLESVGYFAGGRNYESDVEKHFIILSEKNTPPLSIRAQLSAIKAYFFENDIELRYQFWKKIHGRIKGKRARFQDEVPENSLTLRQILIHMDIKGKALFLCLVSSGMRIGESLRLSMADVDIKKNPTRITIRGEYAKNGDSRVVFITEEAKEALEAWLRVRGDWLRSSLNKGKGLGRTKSIDDDRIFPFSDSIATTMWISAVEKAGLTKFDPSVRRRTLHIHVLRKYFRTIMGKINLDYTETLMGHEGYLTGSYRRHSVEDIAKWYVENQHHLYVFTDASEIHRMKEELDKRYREQDTKLQAIDTDKKTMQTLLNVMAEKLELLTTRMKRYEDHVTKWMEMSPEEFDEFMVEFGKRKNELLEKDEQEYLQILHLDMVSR